MIRPGSACVVDQKNSGASIERIDSLSIVSLRVSRNSLAEAQQKLRLASPVSVAGEDPRSLWLGPDRWLLVSNLMTPGAIIRNCTEALDGILHNAVDYSAGLVALRITGPNARQILASGSGVDFRPGKFPVGTCCRTNFAHVAAVIVAESADQFDIYVDRSYENYINDWLADTSGIAEHAAAI
jgi:heterotetrameric sarcosine oxidase gamma subunit